MKRSNLGPEDAVPESAGHLENRRSRREFLALAPALLGIPVAAGLPSANPRPAPDESSVRVTEDELSAVLSRYGSELGHITFVS